MNFRTATAKQLKGPTAEVPLVTQPIATVSSPVPLYTSKWQDVKSPVINVKTVHVPLHDSSNAELHLKKPNPHRSLSVMRGTVNATQYTKDRDCVFLKHGVCHASKNKMLVKIQFS